jgi:hypothetical protein
MVKIEYILIIPWGRIQILKVKNYGLGSRVRLKIHNFFIIFSFSVYYTFCKNSHYKVLFYLICNSRNQIVMNKSMRFSKFP